MALKSMTDKGIQTLSIHAGKVPDPTTAASTPNLVMSSRFIVDEEVSFSVGLEDSIDLIRDLGQVLT